MATKDDGSTRINQDTPSTTGTRTGEDVTSRMTGARSEPVRSEPVRTEAVRTETVNAETTGRDERVVPREVADAGIRHLKTSAAAAFALVFGVAALFSALTAVLAPVAIVLAVVGIVLAVVGRKMSRKPGITGRTVATGGLVTSVLALLVGLAVVAGASVLVNNDTYLNKVTNKIDKLKTSVPSGSELKAKVPGQ